jgi:acyl carrier protein
MTQTRAEIDGVIRQILTEIRETRPDGLTMPPLTDDTVLLDTGLDSLDFAILVTRLDEVLGFDPFSDSATAVYPQTWGALVSFYADARRP